MVVSALSCSSSPGLQQDVGEATITESKSDVSGCVFISKVSASVDLPRYGGDHAAAMDQLFDNLRNDALHKRCDTVYLISVQETETQITAVGEGYACQARGISDGPRGGPPLP
jgi:hypothetical protein